MTNQPSRDHICTVTLRTTGPLNFSSPKTGRKEREGKKNAEREGGREREENTIENHQTLHYLKGICSVKKINKKKKLHSHSRQRSNIPCTYNSFLHHFKKDSIIYKARVLEEEEVCAYRNAVFSYAGQVSQG